MPTTLALQVDLKSNGDMELGLNTSALRYYADRGLVMPERHAGRRMYRPEQLRRLAFIQLMQCLGVRLDAAAATSSSTRWPVPPITRSTNVHT
jgi:hypothetical protein